MALRCRLPDRGKIRAAPTQATQATESFGPSDQAKLQALTLAASQSGGGNHSPESSPANSVQAKRAAVVSRNSTGMGHCGAARPDRDFSSFIMVDPQACCEPTEVADSPSQEISQLHFGLDES